YENWQITQGGETKLFSEWQAEAGEGEVIVTLTDQGDDGKDYDFVATQGEDGSLTLTLHENSVPGPESINLDGVLDLQVPIDDSTDFTFEVDTTTFEYDDDSFSDLANRELNPEAEIPDYCGEESETVSDSLPIQIGGVAGPAETGFAYEEGGEVCSVETVTKVIGVDAAFEGFSAAFVSNAEGAPEVNEEGDYFISVKNPSDEAITYTWEDAGSGQSGSFEAPPGWNKVAVDLPANMSNVTFSYEGNENTSNNLGEPALFELGDSDWVAEQTTSGVTYVEDGERLAEDHGADSTESPLVVPVNYMAATQDSDGSEGIVEVRLSNTSDGGTWQVAGGALGQGDDPVEVEVPTQAGGTTTATASVDGDGQLVLSFADPGAESVDLSSLVGVELPIDDSSDFRIDAATTTREYDDDAFANLETRELKDGYEFNPDDPECADSEHVTESSLDVRVG
ncbi:hypothetical protein, partial [Fodinicurvata fenggangensis]|uniref:hypothetical protein n=1 Tax=Fodinicurvata fenggangensis TaxID=1121830 RepID=UPI0005550334